jgi:hypothetical protein
MGMILEGIISTISAQGDRNLAPMGPHVFPQEIGADGQMHRLLLRPFQTSLTFRNLLETGQGVFHLTDDVLLLARATLGWQGPAAGEPRPALRPAQAVRGWVLEDCCQFYEFRVISCDRSQARAEVQAEVVAQGHGRAFLGFNRARHAVIEAAILVTRLHLVAPEEVQAEFRRLAILVEKTAGEREKQAFALLEQALMPMAHIAPGEPAP